MRFIFLVITLGFASPLFGEILQAESLPQEIKHHKFIPGDPSFEAVRKAYKGFNYSEAIRITKQLMRQKKNLKVRKTATFLLGDIYFDIAKNGRPFEYKRALTAFQGARARYDGSDEAVHALWKVGMIYLNQRLFYEALASFNLILKNHPKHPLVISAQFGKAKTFLAWRKYAKAIAEYDSIDPRKLNHAQQIGLLLGYGDTYLQLNMVNTAYRYYKLVPVHDPILLELPDTIFQYGLSALHSKEYKRAITLFSTLQNRYPGGSDTLMALSLIGDAWRSQGMSHRAKNIYKMVRKSQKSNIDGQLAKITAALGTLHLAGCSPRPILLSEADCKKMNPLTSKTGLRALERIDKKADILFSAFDNPIYRRRLPRIESTLLESILALEQHGAYTLSLQLKEHLLEKKIHKNTKKKLRDSLQQTVIMATTQLLANKDDIAILSVFFRHRSQFSGDILNGNTGLQVGIGLTEAGFHQEASTVLSPLAELNNKRSEKALYYLVKANYGRGAYSLAEQNLQNHIKRYPESPREAALQIISAEISEQEELNTQAIKKYRAWLMKYPEDQQVHKVHLSLARSYEQNGDLHQAIANYLKVVMAGAAKGSKLQIKVADLYFRLKKYKKAASYYKQGFQLSQEGPQKEWAKVQLANSYTALGQSKLGKTLFTQLAKQAEDDIIKGYAEQKSVLKEADGK